MRMIRKNGLLSAVLSACLIAAWKSCVEWNWILIPLAMILFPFLAAGLCWENWRASVFGFIFGLLFGFAQVAGARIDIAKTLFENWWEFGCILVITGIMAIAFAGVFQLLIQALQNKVWKPSSKRNLNPRWVFWGSTAFLLACWLPYLLAFYPGLFTYDISWQYQQYKNWELNTHHPLLHTLLVGGFCDLGWYIFGYPSKGLLLYTLFQMGMMAFAMSSAIRFLYKHHAPFWFCLCLLIADAVLPFNKLLVISSTKDTLFAGAVLYLCVLLMEAFMERDTLYRPWWMLRFVLTEMAVGMLRNNGFVCMAGIAVAVFVWLRKKRVMAKRLLALSLCGLIAASAAGKLLQHVCNAEDGHFREMLSAPLQQLARVYVLTDDEAKPEIKEWIPNVEQYSPDLADMVKNTFDSEKSELPKLAALWAKVGLRHPLIYLDSVLATCEGLYRISAACTGQYLETKFHTDIDRWMVDDSKWPALRAWTAEMYSQNGYTAYPLLALILSPALWVWIMLFALALGLCLRRKTIIFPGIAVLLLYLTTLLGPCVMARYVYPFMLTAPLLLGALLIPSQKDKSNENF